MPARESGFRHAMRRLTAHPDEAVRGLGHSGERNVARARLLLCVLALPLPLLAAAWGADPAWTLAHLGATVLANALALLWLLLARRQRPWLAYASSAFDVTLVTGLLVALDLRWGGSVADAAAAWPLYLLVIGSAALRVDGRLTLYVGGLALGQYVLFEAATVAFADADDALVSAPGWVAAGAFALRLLMLVLATATTAAVVRRMQSLVELSGHDGLTGLPNRSWLLQRMPHVFASARNSGASLTLVLLDIDRFRRVNEEAGPQAGDRALRHLAATMSAMLADGEALARIGGQEFVLVLHGPAGSAWERLDRLRRTLVEHPFLPERGRDAFAFTFSAGIAAWPHDGANTSSLLGCADRRMRNAKAAGGNRIVARDA